MKTSRNHSLNETNRSVWIESQLKKIPSGKRLLDAGAGEQQYRKYCTHLDYVSQDFALYNPENKPEGLQMEKWDYGKLDIISDITDIPEPDSSFDAILCSEVLEHVPDPVATLKELSRLLKVGGVLIITAPFSSITHFAPYHFSTGFNRYFYEHHFKLLQFEIEEFDLNGNYFQWLEQELGRFPSIAKKYTGEEPGLVGYRSLAHVRKMLREFSAKDQNSSELLAFGCHVRAVKK